MSVGLWQILYHGLKYKTNYKMFRKNRRSWDLGLDEGFLNLTWGHYLYQKAIINRTSSKLKAFYPRELFEGNKKSHKEKIFANHIFDND